MVLVKVKSDYDKAVHLIKSAKKYEKKGKTEKANKNMKKLKIFNKSNKKNQIKLTLLTILDLQQENLEIMKDGEKYYLQGLDIEPNHYGINEYLGELYVATNRINLAKERLKVLESCNCELRVKDVLN